MPVITEPIRKLFIWPDVVAKFFSTYLLHLFCTKDSLVVNWFFDCTCIYTKKLPDFLKMQSMHPVSVRYSGMMRNNGNTTNKHSAENWIIVQKYSKGRQRKQPVKVAKILSNIIWSFQLNINHLFIWRSLTTTNIHKTLNNTLLLFVFVNPPIFPIL